MTTTTLPSGALVYSYGDGDMTDWTIVHPVADATPAEPMPEVPPPCWDTRAIDPDRAMAAVRAMCG